MISLQIMAHMLNEKNISMPTTITVQANYGLDGLVMRKGWMVMQENNAEGISKETGQRSWKPTYKNSARRQIKTASMYTRPYKHVHMKKTIYILRNVRQNGFCTTRTIEKGMMVNMTILQKH
jgi:hypothetical protein